MSECLWVCSISCVGPVVWPNGLTGARLLGSRRYLVVVHVMRIRGPWPRQRPSLSRVLFLLRACLSAVGEGMLCAAGAGVQFFHGIIAIAAVLCGACVFAGDYQRMYERAREFFDLISVNMVAVVSMGNDLIASSRPIPIRGDLQQWVVDGIRRVLGRVQSVLVYGGSGATWGYPEGTAEIYDRYVGLIVDAVDHLFHSVTRGVRDLSGVRPTDAIGHLDLAGVCRVADCYCVVFFL